MFLCLPVFQLTYCASSRSQNLKNSVAAARNLPFLFVDLQVQRCYMKFQKLLQVQILMRLSIQLKMLSTMGLMCALLVSSEGKQCKSIADVETQTNSGLPKFITEPYFQKHGSLLNSKFESFLAKELSLGSCQGLQDNPILMPRVLVLQRQLIGEGSHRHLSFSIRIQPESTPEPLRHSCKILVIEKLPSGVFADPFELQHLLQQGVFADAAVFGDTNLELPSVASNRSVVEVHMDISQNLLSGNSNALEVKIEIPLHARYPPLGKSGFSRVEFGGPDLLMQCKIEMESGDYTCLHAPIVDGESQPVVWEIPCGMKEHSPVVSVVTFISALVSAFSIVLTTIFYPK
ncbi:hypothetical protein NMG60_11032616 [Bertholletia excelsa]